MWRGTLEWLIRAVAEGAGGVLRAVAGLVFGAGPFLCPSSSSESSESESEGVSALLFTVVACGLWTAAGLDPVPTDGLLLFSFPRSPLPLPAVARLGGGLDVEVPVVEMRW